MPAALPEGIQRINANLQRAVTSGRFVVTVAWIEDGQIRLERETSDAFPRADFPKLAEMFVDGLTEEFRRQNAEFRKTKKAPRSNRARDRKA